jgi:hypothetical protein
MDKEEIQQPTNVILQHHVPDHFNTTVSGILFIAVLVDIVIADQVGLLELTDPAVIDSENHVIASLNSMNSHGNVSDAHMVKQDSVITPVLPHHHVPDLTNTMVSGIPFTAVHADTATKDQVGSLEPTDQDVTDQE